MGLCAQSRYANLNCGRRLVDAECFHSLGSPARGMKAAVCGVNREVFRCK